MTKSFWFGDKDQKGNFSNGKQDTFDPKKRYIGIRLQQGVPLLDRDWNELEDIRRNEEQMLRSWYIGDGIPGDTGFKIMPLDKPVDDFKINNGRCMVDGFLVINDSDILYSAQTEGEADADKISEMTKFFVYLDVWIEEVNGEGDPALKNENDVKMETCVRHQLKWRVRVRSGKLVSKKNHHYYDLAKVERGQTGSIEETNISDLRRTGLSLYRLRDELAANQMADSLHRHSKLVAIDGSPDPALSVDKSGKVGIGTENPSRPLHVEGEIHSGGAGAGFSFADRSIKEFVQDPAKGDRWVWYSKDGIARLWSGGDKLSITHDGNVGIGTVNPAGKLSVYGVSTGQIGIEVAGSVGGSHIPWSNGNIYLTGDISEKATGSGAFVFRAYDGGKYYNRLVIDGKTGNTTLHHPAQKDAINTSKIGLELQSADGGGVIYGNGINHSIFFRRGRDGTVDVTDYHQYGSHRFFTGGVIQNQKERMRIDANGNVGIGAPAPSGKLSIGGVETGQTGIEVLGGVGNSHIPFRNGNIYLTGDISEKATGSGAFIFRAYDGKNYSNKLVIDGKTGDVTIKGNLGTHGYSATPKNEKWGGGIHTWDVEVEGTIWANKHWDLAENYLSDMDLGPGDVVCLDEHKDRIVLSEKPNDVSVLGVVSAEPGMVLNGDCDADDAKAFPIALCGRVPCKIIDENGPVRRGDLLTSSSTHGHAMKAIPVKIGDETVFRTGTIIGKALESHKSGKGTIDIWRIQS